MKITTLGRTNLKVSKLCLGCMGFGGPDVKGWEWTKGYEESKRIIERAIDLGINFFDTADVYSRGRSEEIIGKVLEGRRNDVILTTKVGARPIIHALGRRHIIQQLAKSLVHLRTNHIDLYQVHRWDYGTPIEHVLRILTDMVRKEGKVDYIGASSMWSWQFANALCTSDRLNLERFVTMQGHYNLAYREEEREMIPFCMEE